MKTSNQLPQTPSTALSNTITTQMNSARRRRRNLLLDLPITWRLTLGFLLAALIAALAAGISGGQRAQSLNNQSDFYQNLLQINTSLTTGSGFLQLMNTEVHTMLADASVTTPSQETLTTDQTAIAGLTTRYDTILANYVKNYQLDQHPNQVALLDEAGHTSQIAQQRTLLGSTLRTWQIYRSAQQQIIQDLIAGNITNAQSFIRSQAEPTNADSLSALRALIQFNGRLASSVQDAALVEEQSQLITTIVAAVLAFLGVGVVGWIISRTLVIRLFQLRRVTQSVEQGQLSSRIEVAGRDEIAEVSLSVNTMLDTIVGLLHETGNQRDALTNAAAHLFSDMRVVSAGDLRVNAPVSDDPIGMLANAFNFTVGRFRRFIMRTQSTVEQLDVIIRQMNERTDVVINTIQNQPATTINTGSTGPISPIPSRYKNQSPTSTPQSGRSETSDRGDTTFLIQSQSKKARDQLLMVAHECATQFRSLIEQSEQVQSSIGRLRSQAFNRPGLRMAGAEGLNIQTQLQELSMLEAGIQKLNADWQEVQKNTIKGLIDLEATLKPLSTMTARLNNADASPIATQSNVVSIQGQELARIAQVYAQEIITLTRRQTSIIQEMRNSIVPFNLEAVESGNSGPLANVGIEEFSPLTFPQPRR